MSATLTTFPATTPAILPAHFASAAPHPLVALLRVPKNESGFRHIYRAHANDQRWVAKVRVAGRLRRIPGSASPLPHQAALHAVCWYQDRYGANWMQAVGHRGSGGCPPWRVWPFTREVWQLNAENVLVNHRLRGFAARVWEYGKPVELTGIRKPRHIGDTFDTADNVSMRLQSWQQFGRLLHFESRETALAAIRRWIEVRWGERERDAVWRW